MLFADEERPDAAPIPFAARKRVGCVGCCEALALRPQTLVEIVQRHAGEGGFVDSGGVRTGWCPSARRTTASYRGAEEAYRVRDVRPPPPSGEEAAEQAAARVDAARRAANQTRAKVRLGMLMLE